MECRTTHEDLIGYHFQIVPEASRRTIEAHLLECRECLCSYFELKSHMGISINGPVPSMKSRERLRKEVYETFRPSFMDRLIRYFSMPIPLYKGATVLVLVGLAFGLAGRVEDVRTPVQEPAPNHVKDGGMQIDSSNDNLGGNIS